jgi:hypothetical protein
LAIAHTTRIWSEAGTRIKKGPAWTVVDDDDLTTVRQEAGAAKQEAILTPACGIDAP